MGPQRRGPLEQRTEPAGAEVLSRPPSRTGDRRRAPALVGVLGLALTAGAAVHASARTPDAQAACGRAVEQTQCSARAAELPTSSATAALVAFVHDYCPRLRRLSVADVVRPVARRDGEQVRAQVDVRCPTDPGTRPALRLSDDQLASSVAAADLQSVVAIDFGKVAERTVSAWRLETPPRLFGWFTCDTHALDLSALRVGSAFSCFVNLHVHQRSMRSSVVYRVVGHPPYFAPHAATGRLPH